MENNENELTIQVSKKEKQILEKIAKNEGETINRLLKNYIENRVYTYEENSITCDDCGKTIKEGTEYFVQDSSISKYEKQNGRIEEDKIDAWVNFCICMDCKDKRDTQKINSF